MTIFLKKHLAPIVFVVLGVMPVIRWFFIEPLSFRFADLNATATSLGQIFGLLGVAFFALTLILSSRLKILDKLFYGLSDVYSMHHRMGQISFILLLLHPLFLVVKFLSFSLRNAAMFFVPQGSDAVSFGIYALLGMIVLISLTIYIKLKYHTWKISHKFMVLVFVMALFHIVLIESDISRDIFIRYYIFALSLLGLMLSFYQAFLSMYFSKNYEYIVKNIKNLSSDVVEIELKARHGARKLEFKSGQFVFLKFLSNAVGNESHPFTISSGSKENNLKFIIKNLGDYTSKLKNLSINDKVFVNGSFGKFNFKNVASKNQVWLAGGVGITPFISMAKDLSVEDKDYKIDLFYCVKNKSELIMLNELDTVLQQNKNFKIVNWCSDDSGFINANEVTKLAGSVLNKDYFICGPEAFMVNLKNQLLSQGVKNKNIHWENFSF